MLPLERVVAPARHRVAEPARRPRAVRVQQHRIAPIAKQRHRFQRVGAGQQLTGRQGRAAVAVVAVTAAAFGQRRQGAQRAYVAGHRLMQQRRDGAHARVRHEPAAHHAVQQHVGQRYQRHALVVGHEGGDAAHAAAGLLARGGEIQRLDKAVAVASATPRQAQQVAPRGDRFDLRRQQRGVRRNHAFGRRRAAQRQPRCALRPVLIGQRGITLGMRRFRHAPRQVPFAAEQALLAHRDDGRSVQQAAFGLVDQQHRHQVLEHRARPALQTDAVAVREGGAFKPRPVLHRHVALGDGQQAGQPRF